MDPIRLILPKVPMRGRLLMKGRTWQAQHFKKKREQGEWQLLIRTEGRGRLPAKPLSRVVIDVLIHRRTLDRDADNLMYSLKPFLDALKAERVIFEDSAKHVTVNTPRQFKIKDPGAEQTIVVIREREMEYNSLGIPTNQNKEKP